MATAFATMRIMPTIRQVRRAKRHKLCQLEAQPHIAGLCERRRFRCNSRRCNADVIGERGGARRFG
jgi:hypothetical protein